MKVERSQAKIPDFMLVCSQNTRLLCFEHADSLSMTRAIDGTISCEECLTLTFRQGLVGYLAASPVDRSVRLFGDHRCPALKFFAAGYLGC